MTEPNLLEKKQFDALNVKIYDSSKTLGQASAAFVARRLKQALDQKDHANMIFATGASQFDFLAALRTIDTIDWSKITTFHLDEYIGLSPDHNASFRKYLHERIIDIVEPAEAHFLQGDASNIEAERERYESLLKTHPIDIACIGIGENGHIAFNDPPVADFNDPYLVKVVELDEQSRKQQVGEGWFDSLDEVPTQALTLTIPAIMQSETISCVVPDRRKAQAVQKTLHGPISTDTPATILRKHPDATLLLDTQSATELHTNQV